MLENIVGYIEDCPEIPPVIEIAVNNEWGFYVDLIPIEKRPTRESE